MTVQCEPVGGHVAEVSWAGVHIEGAATIFTNEMVVVILTRQFISRGLTGQFDSNDFAEFFERSDGSVNRCNTQLWGNFACLIKDLLGGEWVALWGEE
jgi:hypothetical protein